jgi:hypothetical protein
VGTEVDGYSITFQAGGLIFEKDVSGTACLNPTTNDLANTINSNIIGGTGQFAGATGTSTANGVGSSLSSPCRLGSDSFLG